MYIKKYHTFLLFFSFLRLFQLSAMKPEEKNSVDIVIKKFKKIAIDPQKNFKKICFGFVDDKVYDFPESCFSTIECAGYLKKIIKFLKKTDSLLFLNLWRLCLASRCPCDYLKGGELYCFSCMHVYGYICEKFKVSKNKAIKALQEIKYHGRVIVSKEGIIPKESKELIIKVIEMFEDRDQIYEDIYSTLEQNIEDINSIICPTRSVQVCDDK